MYAAVRSAMAHYVIASYAVDYGVTRSLHFLWQNVPPNQISIGGAVHEQVTGTRDQHQLTIRTDRGTDAFDVPQPPFHANRRLTSNNNEMKYITVYCKKL